MFDRMKPPNCSAAALDIGWLHQIDPNKDGEVYHNACVTPGRHDCAGWFHFVGTPLETGDFSPTCLGEGFTVWMCGATAPRLASLKGLPVVQLEFHAESVPWLLDEPKT